jgi:glycosyltransferase involved in cell wall biosynthesis
MRQATDHQPQAREDVEVSIIVPLLNERENVAALYQELTAVLDADWRDYECLFIDDGSTDGTLDALRETIDHDPRVTIVQFTRCFGQTAALAAGFTRARGRVIVPMDGDGQNDPADVPRLVETLEQHAEYDIVSGWRKDRQDRLLSRRLPSAAANLLVRRLTWTREVSDFGCSMKAYRREVLEDVHLYGEMHRFLPAICKWRGARIIEQVVNHRPRTAGDSKYGLRRTLKVMLDLLTVKFLGDYLTKPIYFFGKVALIGFALAFLAGTFAIIQKLGYLTEHGAPVNLNDNVFILFAMMTVLVSALFVMMGVLSELLVRIYHESQDRRPYKVRQLIHCDATLAPPVHKPAAAERPNGNGGPVGTASVKD